AACVAVSTMFDNPLATTLCFATASFCTHVTLPTWWMTVIEFSGKHVGALFGLLNGGGGIGASASQFFIGWVTEYPQDLGYLGRDQWDPAFWVYVVVLAIGSLGWLLIDPARKLEE